MVKQNTCVSLQKNQAVDMKTEYAILEWIWDEELIRCNLPGNKEYKTQGSYAELVQVLNRLGQEGWEVCASASEANWIFWTLKRPLL
jgi:hypothetical protein